MMMLRVGIELLAAGAVVAAAAIDVRRYEIPDALPAIVAATAIADGLLTAHFGWLAHGAAGMAMFGFGLFAFGRGWLGGGDVKLMTALALWTGLAQLPVLLLGIALGGGVLVLLIHLSRLVLFAGLDEPHRPRVTRRDQPLPYAVAIAAGTLWWVMTYRITLA